MNSGNRHAALGSLRAELLPTASECTTTASPVEGCFRRLEESLSDLRQLRCALADRLSVVLAVQPPTAADLAKPQPVTGVSALEESLEKIHSQVRHEHDAISELLSRLRL